MDIMPNLSNQGDIPVIDISAIRTDDARERDQLASEIWEASRNVGFFSIVDHGIPGDLTHEVFSQIRAFFDLPAQSKISISNKKSRNMRGYFGIGEESPEDTMAGDLKEGFDLSVDLLADDPDFVRGSTLYGPNQWPPDMPVFKQVMTTYHTQMTALSIALLGLFARALGKPESYFAPLLRKPLAQLRLLRYPPHDTTSLCSPIGCGEHTDYGAIALLAQDAPGLEVQDKRGRWIEVGVVPGAFVVNIGDLMARWTNDRLQANVHRVVNRRADSRHAAAFFLDPDYDALIECIDSCVPTGQQPIHEPIVFGCYNEAKLNATFEFRKQS
ncbi:MULTISPECIES: isopenicillin N synthase family oxygenase [Paraburkholderia]|uniref:isopenicillin N synthase family dioxygenase n=1 Tax=Paraburkholderia TaxID=1822464 RepID=UPI002255ACC3|nr:MULTISPECIES: 2-oxoglutarate and iron-dependent oxygenase domain-containing protein [Paraburkholderia]MCX4162779.1 isopenicillin N synthase family oxygenase [Paraburkholderia megapolitana]MDN7158274.1 isopenicillin N synthase family oxygenase [Paraburkholderia sp. CHISQ3]MDQ6495321.1 isopenicillin N synthase family oxygenase [Paraburkholderia megapolitana]